MSIANSSTQPGRVRVWKVQHGPWSGYWIAHACGMSMIAGTWRLAMRDACHLARQRNPISRPGHSCRSIHDLVREVRSA